MQSREGDNESRAMSSQRMKYHRFYLKKKKNE